MSTKSSTPTSSPKPPKIVRLEAPSTPPAAKNRKRLSAGLSTPDPLHDTVPFSPGLKRTNSGSARSPEPSRNDITSPYSAHNLLKTPGNPDDDSDGRDTPRRAKLMKTPQFFSPGKRLFADDSSPTKKELGEISSQLKSRLSSAFGSLQQREKAGSGSGTTSAQGLGISPGVSPIKLDFSSGSFHAGKDSPTRMYSAPLSGEGSPPAALGRTNLNLQTLQASPRIDASPRAHSRHSSADLGTRFSPVLGSEAYFHSRRPASGSGPVSMPSPDEESSAQTALLVALSRAQERRRSHSSGLRRPSLGAAGEHYPPPAYPLKLPPISVLSQSNADGASEQDAVYSLMSLSSPQQAKHDLHTLQSVASMQAGALASSAESSRSSSVVMPVLPPVHTMRRRVDDDETDVEDSSASEGDETN